jgi:DNA-directed RNA polymerase
VLSEEELTKRQIQLETRVHQDAIARYKEMQTMVTNLGRGSSLAPAQQLLLSWFTPLQAAIEEEVKAIKSKEKGVDRTIYGPHLLLLDSEKLAVIAMHEFINLALADPQGIKVVRVASVIGRAVEAEVRMQVLEKSNKEKWREIAAGEERAIAGYSRRAKQALDASGSDTGWDSKIIVSRCIMRSLPFKRLHCSRTHFCR